MATYKEIHGVNLSQLVSDPSIITPSEIWYNTTSGKFKVLTNVTSGAWATGGNLATAKDRLAGAGTQTAGLAFGGYSVPPDEYNPVTIADTEEYNGSTWTAGGNLATARKYLAGCGTQTAGLGFGGYDTAETAVTEEYDGTAWTAGGNLGTARYSLAGAGTQTAGLAVGGFEGYSTFHYSGSSEEYDGSTWTAGGNLIAYAGSAGAGDGVMRLSGVGTQTAALVFGGYDSAYPVNVTQEYDGSTWTAGGNMAEAVENRGGAGTQTAGLGFGGYDRDTVVTKYTTEEYDGTSWTAGGNLATARTFLGGEGTQTAGLGFGGYTGSQSQNRLTATEEYEGVGTYIKTLTSSS